MYAVDRMVALIRPKQAMLDWVNSLPDNEFDLTLEQLCADCTCILVPEFGEIEDAINYIDDIYDRLFAMELVSWHEDEALWPKERSLKTFWEWFDVEIHSTLVDTVDADLQNHPLNA